MTTSVFNRRKRRKLKSDINVVPYIDVMLVLLIIFMVTTPLLNLTVTADVELPQSSARALETKSDPLIVTVRSDGQLALQLLFSLAQLGGCERLLHQSVQLTAYQSAATFHIMRVATEIDTPAARVAIAYHAALHTIDQSVTLTQRQVQSGVETRTT